MAYELVAKGRHLFPRLTTPHVNCGKNRIGFNKSALEFLRPASHVLLLWDKETHRVAVTPTADAIKGFLIQVNKAGSQGYITCTPFLRASHLQHAGLISALTIEGRMEWAIPQNEEVPHAHD